MKPTVMVAVAALLALFVSSAMAGGKVYRATKPHWWDEPAMKCNPPNEHGANWCRAGAWTIHSLAPPGAWDGYLSAMGFGAYHLESKRVAIAIHTVFGDRNVTFTCAGQADPLQVQRERVNYSASAVVYQYWIWTTRAVIEGCLLKPIKITVDGQTFRLDTKLLRQAVENATDRASE